MFKTKMLLAEVSARATLLEEQLNRSIEFGNKQNHEARAEIRNLEERLRDATAERVLVTSQREEITQKLHELEVKNAVLLERLDLMSNYINPTASRLQGPTSMPEEAEDALFAFNQGDIDRGELAKQLARAGYDNTEIEFELSEYPRHAESQ